MCNRKCNKNMKSRRRYFHIYNKTTIAQFFGKILKCARYQMSYRKNFPRPKINKDEIKKGWFNGLPTIHMFIHLRFIRTTMYSITVAATKILFSQLAQFHSTRIYLRVALVGKQNHKYFVFDLPMIKSRQNREKISQDM